MGISTHYRSHGIWIRKSKISYDKLQLEHTQEDTSSPKHSLRTKLLKGSALSRAFTNGRLSRQDRGQTLKSSLLTGSCRPQHILSHCGSTVEATPSWAALSSGTYVARAPMRMAGATELEPAASCVTGRRSNQLIQRHSREADWIRNLADNWHSGVSKRPAKPRLSTD